MANHSFFQLVRSPFKFRLFLISRLPAAWLAGLRIRTVDEQHCTVLVPYKRLTQNPFRSTYFACLSMAAEMSTGVLAMAQVYQRKPAVSMLVVSLEAQFMKKATGWTAFTSEDGEAVRQCVQKAIETGEAQSLVMHSNGVNEAGETIAEFRISWSFKAKT